jgi:hypothetical protein
VTGAMMIDDMNSIKDIVYKDGDELKRLGIDPMRLADKLESLLESAKEGLESPIHLGGMTIRAQWDRGLIPCPMGETGLFPKISAELILTTGGVLRFSSLSIHMIRVHEFFGVPGRMFRLEPKDVAVLLD